MTKRAQRKLKLDRRTQLVTVRLTPAELELWEKKGIDAHKDISEFIRDCVNGAILTRQAESVNVDLGPILTELKDLQTLMNKRDDLIDINRQLLIENAAGLNITDATLEEKILAHLGNRSLFTTQLIEYLQEEPEIIIILLAKLEKIGKITQNRYRKWQKIEPLEMKTPR